MTRWLSKAAVEWALHDAEGVPARLVSTLVAVAAFAGEDGTGAYPASSKVALMTRKSEGQAKRDIAELERLGLLLPGDPDLVKDIRADRRPNVWDLAMPRGASGRAPSGELRGASGRTPPAETRGAPGRTPPGAPRGASGYTTGRISLQHGVRPDAPEEFLKNSGTARGVGASADAPPPRAQTQTPRHAPPCPDCGKPYSPAQLADLEFRHRAMAGDAGCIHDDDSQDDETEEFPF